MMKGHSYTVKEKVWLYPGASAWYFITIKKADAHEIRKEYMWPPKGFGSIPVQVTVGSTTWKTSIFPTKEGEYFLPLKKEVRQKENIKELTTVSATIEVLN